jgi:hypothetical protein
LSLIAQDTQEGAYDGRVLFYFSFSDATTTTRLIDLISV